MRIPIIICEGRSELAYIQNLNRILMRSDGGSAFFPKVADSGNFSAIKRSYLRYKASNKGSDIKIWVDKDIYVTKKADSEAYDKRKNMPAFFFSTMNFEDMLTLHLPKKVLTEWVITCVKHHHFDYPMTDDQYLPLYKQIVFPDYRKGTLPPNLRFTREILETAFANNADPSVAIKCDFLDWLQHEIEDGMILFV